MSKVNLNKLLYTDSICSICGKAIKYGINGAQMIDKCTDCYQPKYFCKVTPAYAVADNSYYDALDYAEDRCLGDDWD